MTTEPDHTPPSSTAPSTAPLIGTAPPGPYDVHLVRGRRAYFARGVPVLEPDAYLLPIPATPSPGELGAVSFARDLGLWIRRIFDREVEPIVYRENRWDHRPCPRAQSYEIVIGAPGIRRLVLVTAYDELTPQRTSTRTAYGLSVDGKPVDFPPNASTRHLPWQLAWAAWKATTTTSHRPG